MHMFLSPLELLEQRAVGRELLSKCAFHGLFWWLEMQEQGSGRFSVWGGPTSAHVSSPGGRDRGALWVLIRAPGHSRGPHSHDLITPQIQSHGMLLGHNCEFWVGHIHSIAILIV